jgi:hypothetical protein
MSRMRLFLIFCVFAWLNTTFANDGKPPTTQQLIEQLGHKQFSQREQAYKLLQARGSDALPELKQALQHPDEEVRARVAKLVPFLEKLAAVEPKRVTLDVDRESLSTILQQIEKQTGYKIESLAKSEDKKYSLKMKNISFWESVELLRRETNSSIQFYPQSHWVEPRRRQTQSKFVSNQGAFRVEAIDFQEERGVKFESTTKENPSGTKNHRLTLKLAIIAEPRFQFRSIEDPMITAILDENHQSFSLLPPKKEEVGEKRIIREIPQFRGDQYPHTVEFSFRRSSEEVKFIKELQGVIPVIVLTEKKNVVIGEKFLESKGTQFKTEYAEFQITSAGQSENGSYYFEIKVSSKQKEDREIRWEYEFLLVDSTGKPLHRFSYSHSAEGDHDLIRLEFSKPSEPGNGSKVKLVFQDWMSVPYEIPFQLKDIPLP